MTRPLTKAKIVVVHPGALGDGLLSLPAIRGLRRHYPRHNLIWIGHKALGEVFLRGGEVHESFPFDSIPVGNIRRTDSFIYRSLQVCDPTRDLMVGWMNDRDGYWKAWARNLGYSRSIFRSPYDRRLTSRHMFERYREILIEENHELCSLPVQDDFRTLKSSFPTFNGAWEPVLSKLPETRIRILLHPGSGSPHKCAGPALWSSLARKLMTRFPEQVGFIVGPADIKYLDPILSLLFDLDPRIFQNLELLTICGLFKQVKLFIGHDSGLSHLAANLGVSSLLLFGPTDPGIWASRGAHIRVREDQDLNFSPDDLCESAEQLLQGNREHLVA